MGEKDCLVGGLKYTVGHEDTRIDTKNTLATDLPAGRQVTWIDTDKYKNLNDHTVFNNE